ncbi:DUF4097 family beta strand repeat protein [candidate division KSB1 bacterium]|nr:DUF4097 family beta strand repeat protein [candidate division KSB1 bacterium]
MRILSYLMPSGIFIFLFMSGCCEYPYENVDNTIYSASEEFSYEVEIGSLQQFKITAINGPIDLVGIPGTSSVRIWGEKIVRSESIDDAESHLDDLRVSVVQDDGTLYLRTEQPERSHGREYIISYHIRIPAHWKVIQSLVNGDVVLDAVSGDVCANLVNGAILLRDLSGSVSAAVTNGNLDARINLPVAGYCTLTTVNGQIQLDVPTTTSAMFSALAMNGNISMQNLTLVDSESSRTSLKGKLGAGEGTITLSAVNGQIAVLGY